MLLKRIDMSSLNLFLAWHSFVQITCLLTQSPIPHSADEAHQANAEIRNFDNITRGFLVHFIRLKQKNSGIDIHNIPELITRKALNFWNKFLQILTRNIKYRYLREMVAERTAPATAEHHWPFELPSTLIIPTQSYQEHHSLTIKAERESSTLTNKFLRPLTLNIPNEKCILTVVTSKLPTLTYMSR